MTWTGGSRIWTGADSLGSVDMDEAAARASPAIASSGELSAVSRGLSTVFLPERRPSDGEFVAVRMPSGASRT